MRHLVTALVVLLSLLPGLALADAAEEVFLLADDVHQQHCADINGAQMDSATAERQAVVTDAWRRVIEVYEQTGHSFLLYWRGVLGECLGSEERAASDLRLFVLLEQHDKRFGAMVKDANRRLKRLGGEAVEISDEQREVAARLKAEAGEVSLARDAPALRLARQQAAVPRLAVALGGGYQRLGPWSYAGAALDVSVGIVGPLRVEGGARPFWSLSKWVDGAYLPTGVYMLPAFHIGAMAQLDGAVRPRFGGSFQIAHNGAGIGGPAAFVGALGRVGVDIPVATSPVALRVEAEAGNMHTWFLARLTGGFVIGFGRVSR